MKTATQKYNWLSAEDEVLVDDMKTLSRLSEIHAHHAPDRTAVIFGSRQMTWKMLHREALQLVGALRSAGIESGDRIAFLGLNSDRYLVLLQACYRMGAILAPLNVRWVSAELEYVLADSGAKLLFADADLLPVVDGLGAEARPGIVMTADQPVPGHIYIADWIATHHEDASDPVEDPETLALLLYTSGTTGKPKGVLLTQGGMLNGFMDSVGTGESWGHWTYDTVMLLASPVFHIGGTNMSTQALAGGGRTIILARPDIPQMLSAIPQYGITKMFVVPAMLNMMLNDPAIDRADLSSMRHLLYGASPIPLDVLRRSMLKFEGAEFIQLYGMTETSGVATWLPAVDHDPDGTRRMASCGRPYVGTEIRIIDENGAALGPDEVGEIIIRSKSVMKGYLNNAEASAAALHDGWYHSGDGGYLDEDGYLYIQGRLKDMIVSGGENIYPAEVEQALADHPAVLDCAVIAIPDERWGEAVKAVIVLLPHRQATAEELQQFLRDKIAGYKIPKSVDFMEALPRTATGKILKRELREPFWRGHGRMVN